MILDCPLKAASSSETVWIASGKTWTYRELDELADRWTGELCARGVRAGSRLAITPSSTPSTLAILFAAWRLGASVCPLHLRLTEQGKGALLERLQPDLILPEDAVPKSSTICLSTIPSDLSSLFLMTSGSTAEPKIAVLTCRQLFANAVTVLPVLDLREGDAWLLHLPLFHVGGLGIVLRCLFARAAIVSDPNYPSITHISCVPTQLYRASPVYKTLRCLLLGGAPVHSYPKELPVFVTYGLTEMGSMVLAKKHPQDGRLGFALPNRNVRLAADGEIFVGGECLFSGYWKEGRLEPAEPWFATKDVGCEDPKEGIKILGRKDWQFISGGENIQPEEIEQYLLQIPGVYEAVVAPRPDPEFGMRPVAFIVGSLDMAAMQKSLSLYLPKFKIPTDLILLDQMPKNGLKIDRKAILEYVQKINQ